MRVRRVESIIRKYEDKVFNVDLKFDDMMAILNGLNRIRRLPFANNNPIRQNAVRLEKELIQVLKENNVDLYPFTSNDYIRWVNGPEQS
jgi:hypothetical protein